jgi:hypothetical protein
VRVFQIRPCYVRLVQVMFGCVRIVHDSSGYDRFGQVKSG